MHPTDQQHRPGEPPDPPDNDGGDALDTVRRRGRPRMSIELATCDPVLLRRHAFEVVRTRALSRRFDDVLGD